jgi:hypothetical protein
MICPGCSQPIDKVESLTDNTKPQTGCCVVCSHCGSLFVFDEQMQLVHCNAKVESALRLINPTIIEMVDKVRFIIQQEIAKN